MSNHNSSQSSSELDSTGKSDVASVTKRSTTSQLPQSRKLEGIEVWTVGHTLASCLVHQPRESESELLTITPVANFEQKSGLENLPSPSVTFLDTQPQTGNHIEVELEHRASKRPRVGSVAVSKVSPESELGSQNFFHSSEVSPAHSSDEMEQETNQKRPAFWSSSEPLPRSWTSDLEILLWKFALLIAPFCQLVFQYLKRSHTEAQWTSPHQAVLFNNCLLMFSQRQFYCCPH